MPSQAPGSSNRDPFASTEMLKNEWEDNPFVADPFGDHNNDEDDEDSSFQKTPAPHATVAAPPAVSTYRQPLKPPMDDQQPPSTTKPGPPSKPYLSYGRPADLPDNVVEHLTRILGRDINVRELFSRLERTRQNAEAWARGERGPVGQSAEFHDSKRDLSKHLYHDPSSTSSDVPGYRDDEGKPKPPSLAKRAAGAFRKALGISPDAPGDASLPSASANYYNPYASGTKPLPSPPSHIHKEDHLSLAIYYHEREELDISAIYLEKSAEEKNPLGLYLRALTLRHGWGVPENKELAFRHLLESAESSLMTIPEVSERRKQKAEAGGNSKAESPLPSSASSTISRTRPADLRSLRSYATVASLLPEDTSTATALLPLPLFEIGMCFRQGWGVLKSYPAAVYYFGIAARLGDPDAMYELGYSYLNKTPGVGASSDDEFKMLAAQWLREADKTGKKVVGESWIWKKKWGGSED